MSKAYFVYIMTNRWNRVFYTGFTGDLVRRVHQHRTKQIEGFTSRYNVQKLVYFEVWDSPEEAIRREKQIKAGSRDKKIRFIERMNPKMKDLYHEIASL